MYSLQNYVLRMLQLLAIRKKSQCSQCICSIHRRDPVHHHILPAQFGMEHKKECSIDINRTNEKKQQLKKELLFSFHEVQWSFYFIRYSLMQLFRAFFFCEHNFRFLLGHSFSSSSPLFLLFFPFFANMSSRACGFRRYEDEVGCLLHT